MEETVKAIGGTDLTVLTILAGAVGGAINSVITGIINYRKTKDAGQLELVKAEQANQSTEIAILKKQHKECEERHAEAITKLTGAIEKQAELKGELAALKHIVLKDTQATDDLRANVAVLSSKIDNKPEAKP